MVVPKFYRVRINSPDWGVEIHHLAPREAVTEFDLIFPFDELRGVSLPTEWTGKENSFLPTLKRYGRRDRGTSWHPIPEYATSGYCTAQVVETTTAAWPGEVDRALRAAEYLGILAGGARDAFHQYLAELRGLTTPTTEK
jgi:hypothetical protein